MKTLSDLLVEQSGHKRASFVMGEVMKAVKHQHSIDGFAFTFPRLNLILVNNAVHLRKMFLQSGGSASSAVGSGFYGRQRFDVWHEALDELYITLPVSSSYCEAR